MLILSISGYASHILGSMLTDSLVYALASYLNKVRVSFFPPVSYGLHMHAVSEDCSYFYKYLFYCTVDNTAVNFPGDATVAKHAIVTNRVVQFVSPERANSLS